MKKIWKVREDARAGISLQTESVTMSVGATGGVNGIRADTTGLYLSGKLSIMTVPDQIRVGGFWLQNSPFMQMLPSTTAFPVPHLIPNLPVGAVDDIVEAVGWAMGFLV